MMKRGRPRTFDIDDAIEKAMRLFWMKGYQGTTIPDLTAALGINRPSLYAAFGDKESLFKLALDRYRKDPASYLNRALAMPTAFETFQSLLHGVVDLLTDRNNPGGCLFVCGALAGGEASAPILDEMKKRRLEGEREIRKRFEQAVKNGDLARTTDVKSLAKFAATQMWGLSVQSMNGSRKKELLAAAELAIKAFPADRNDGR